MQAENWGKVKKILQKVLELEPLKRREFLDKAATTAEIRAEVESLLAVEAESKDFMSLPITDYSKDFLAEDAPPEKSPVGQRIGCYEITQELGFGGMGAVYLGKRADGKFEQKVALKMLRREFNIEKIRRYFKRESEILATLEHPFIARLLDVGTTDDGIPFILMEYVEGVPVDKFCTQKNLSLSARLKLFNKICQAVAHAHQNLIVHRDLKPSNILINRDGEPKLLDFGISKLLDAEDATDKTAITLLGAMTPEYASPEQIKGETVSTATDIYSLGIVLYKILTGTLPFDVKGKTNGELLKSITEDQPTAPSTVQSSKLKTQNSKEENPKSTIHNPKSLKGDLDNIILKAIRKEPEQRYKSVEQLSADIWRHLDGMPVRARPATVLYRVNKFIKRHKIAVIAASLIFFSLITGLIVSFRQTKMAEAAQSLAESETNRAKTEQAKSEKITRFMSKIIAYANPAWYAEGAKYGGNTRVIEALEDLSDKIDTEFANEPDIAAELHHRFGEVFGLAVRNVSGERAEYFTQRAKFHILRALELRKQFYGEWHELVAKDLYYSHTLMGKDDREKAELLMQAILMMRETNPNNLNLPYMLEDYTVRLMIPRNIKNQNETYLNAVQPATDENKYQVGERYLREALPVFQLYYKENTGAIPFTECLLSYSLLMQEKQAEFDAHYPVCKKDSKESWAIKLVEKTLAEKKAE